MPDVYVRLREGGEVGGVPIPADGRVRLTPILVPDQDAWVTSAPTVLDVVAGAAEPVAVSPGRWRVDVVSESWARRWELDIVESAEPVNLVTLVPVDPATPVPWLPTEADLVFIRETRERIPDLIEEAVAEGDYTGPPGEPGEPGPPGDPGPAPDVSWDGPVLVVGGERSPDLTGPGGPAPTVGWDGPRLVVGGVSGPDLTGPQGVPGTVPTAADYMVVGPGRPDAPTTTGMTSAALDALPVGAEYRSTDGASVGAWVWRKRPTGWDVIDGDTGWLDVSGWIRGGSGGGDPVLPTSGTLHIRRVNNWITWDSRRFIVPKDDAPAILIPPGLAGTGMVLAANWDQTGLRTFNYEPMSGGNYRVRAASGVQSPWGGQITSIAPTTAAEPWPTSLSPTL